MIEYIDETLVTDEKLISDNDILSAYNEYLSYLAWLDAEELELQKQHEMEAANAMFSV
tara:strand:+ start:329 stop:502 length:174 start_codon:yes stop_codon:yes gene_type:complete